MNPSGYVKVTMSVLMAAIVVISVLVPVVYGASMTTATITNEGAGWAKFAYNDEATDYNIAMSAYGSNLTLGDQTGAADEMIVYASDVFSILYADDSFKLVAPSGAAADLGSSAAVASSSGTVTVTDANSTPVYGTDAVTWSYVPDVDGSFGFFTETGKTVKDFPVAAAGSFAGAYAYNEINSLDLATLAPTYSVTDGVFNAGNWANANLSKAAKVVRITPDEEKKTEKLADTLIKAGTTYTDGDWRFTVNGTNVYLTKYLGTDTDVTLPLTLSDGTNTYTITMCNGTPTAPILPATTETVTVPEQYVNVAGLCTDSAVTAVSLPSTLLNINGGAFSGCTELKNIDLPDSLEYLQTEVFAGSGLTSVILPASLIACYGGAFKDCASLKSVVVLGNNSFSSTAVFDGAAVEELLNLGTIEITAGSNGLSADVDIRDNIPSLGYVAPLTISETVQNTGLVYTIMSYIPVLIIVGLMVGVVGVFLSNRRA